MEYRYFKVTGGKVRELYDDFMSQRKKQVDARIALMNRVGGNNIYGCQSHIVGFCFESDKAPKGWRRFSCGDDVWFKPPTTKEGKLITKEMNSLRLSDASDFHHLISSHAFFGSEGGKMFITHIYPEELGGVLYLRVPYTDSGVTWKGPDKYCVFIKTSAYHLAREKAEAAKKKGGKRAKGK